MSSQRTGRRKGQEKKRRRRKRTEKEDEGKEKGKGRYCGKEGREEGRQGGELVPETARWETCHHLGGPSLRAYSTQEEVKEVSRKSRPKAFDRPRSADACSGYAEVDYAEPAPDTKSSALGSWRLPSQCFVRGISEERDKRKDSIYIEKSI